MARILRPFTFMLAALALLGIAGCAPAYTNSTYSGAAIGRTADVTYGTILSMRNVAVNNGGGGIGTLAGAAAGGVAGSFIGGDPRSNILGALGGALLGGVVGNVVGNQVSTGIATEFIIRQDDGQTISVVQTNENQFVPGDRVAIIRGDRTRIARVTS
ncbi:MAG TPA: glycine zipper 2TM domain-containing protein [Acetobacteraceae bacterium]|nr:glycine zipper 2TM domain-containing protein [Acetobacteraceae bacterium]